MNKVMETPFLTGTLEEMIKSLRFAESIESAFMGKEANIKPPFRIPAADTKTEVFFNNRELLSRFANLPLPTQEDFLKAVRQTMANEGVKEIRLAVRWSKQTIRTVIIEAPTELHEQLHINII